MRIVDLLKKQSIDLNASVADHLVDLMAAGGNLNDKELYKQRVLAREQEGSTGIGEGIAIPHAKTEAVNEPGLASMIVRDGVDYESLDDEPAHLFFLIAAPAGGANVHLEVLSRLSRMLMDDDFRDNLMKAQTPEEYLAAVNYITNVYLTPKPNRSQLKKQKLPLKPLPKKHRLKRKRPLRRIVLTSSASQPARRALPTPTWQQKPWKTKPLPWASTSKSKRMVPAVSRTT